MKKNLVMLILMIGVLFLTGCSEKDLGTKEPNDVVAETEGENSQIDEEVTEDYLGGPVTEELVRNYPVTDASEFEIENNSTGVTITKYLGNNEIVVIPETIDGKNVTEISRIVFGNESIVKGIYIPSTVEMLEGVFANNKVLEVAICEGIKRLEAIAFGNCSSLHTLILSDSLEYIGDSVFAGCTALQEVYISPTAVVDEAYVYTAFLWCDNITIVGKKGSPIETFANESGFTFKEK